MNDAERRIDERARAVLANCERAGLRIACAESCTGGLIAAALTEVPGSSLVFECAFVTYSNAAKTRLLGVPVELIEKWGAVSPQIAAAMAQGACERSGADLAVAVTGIAGPGGGSADKPVGLVYLSCQSPSGPTVGLERRYGDAGRSRVRREAVADALVLLDEMASSLVRNNRT